MAPPLSPSSEQARELLRAELAKGQYADRRSVLQRVLEWLDELLQPGSSGPGVAGVVLWALLVAVLVTLAVLVARRLRRDPRAQTSAPGGLFEAGPATADEHRDRSRAALTSGAWGTAVVEAFRAIARRGVERTVLADAPGLTALEVALALAAAFPSSEQELHRSAATFDEVRYGERSATEAQARALIDLEQHLAASRPVLAGPALAPGPLG